MRRKEAENAGLPRSIIFQPACGWGSQFLQTHQISGIAPLISGASRKRGSEHLEDHQFIPEDESSRGD